MKKKEKKTQDFAKFIFGIFLVHVVAMGCVHILVLVTANPILVCHRLPVAKP